MKPELHPYVILDVFTDTPLQGNQLAVFTDGGRVPSALMQRIARELNLSETVFVLAPQDGADARVRIFTPATELPFAGHPVLGTAFVVAEGTGAASVTLLTDQGMVPIELNREDGEVVFGEMDQPIPSWEPHPEPQVLLRALGVVGTGLQIEVYDNGPRHTFVELPDTDTLAALRPDMAALERLGAVGVSCFVATGISVGSRMFGPGLGVPEDPATGSAAGPLAVHLARHGRTDFGQRIEITQGVEIGRRSTLFAEVRGSPDQVTRVLVGGSAVIVARGEYRLT